MKTKRIAVIVAIMTISILAGGTSAFASGYKTISSTSSDVNLTGYIDYLEGPFTIKDKIWYTGTLWGSDASACTGSDIYITPGTDKQTLPSKILTGTKTRVSGNGVKCGNGGSYGMLKMRCVEKSTICTLYS